MSKIRWGEKVYALMQLQSTSQNFSTYAGVEKAFLLAPCDIEKFKNLLTKNFTQSFLVRSQHKGRWRKAIFWPKFDSYIFRPFSFKFHVVLGALILCSIYRKCFWVFLSTKKSLYIIYSKPKFSGKSIWSNFIKIFIYYVTKLQKHLIWMEHNISAPRTTWNLNEKGRKM